MKNFGESVLLIFLISGAFLSGWYLIHMKNGLPEHALTENQIGTLKPQGSDVRVRALREEGWSKVHNTSSVFNKDRVFTGVNSTASIGLKKDQEITIEPNSLIVIDNSKESLTLDIDKGGFFSVLKKGLKLTVKRGNVISHLEANSDHTSVSLEANTDKQLKIIVHQGEMVLKDESSVAPPTIIPPNTEATIISPPLSSSSNEVPTPLQFKKLQAHLNEPSPGQRLRESTETQWSFRWSWENTIVETNQVEIARDPLFENIVTKITTQNTSLILPAMVPGVYYWRVTDTANFQNQSPIGIFFYDPAPPPLAIEKEIQKSVNLTTTEELPSSETIPLIAPKPEAIDPEIISNNPLPVMLRTVATPKSELSIPELESAPPSKESSFSKAPETSTTTQAKIKESLSNDKTSTVRDTKVAEIPKSKFEPTNNTDRQPSSTGEPTSPIDETNPTTSPFSSIGDLFREFSFPAYWVWIGAGVSLTLFNENLTGYSSGSFGSIDSPQIFIRTGGFFTDESGFDLIYNETPGRLTNETGGTSKIDTFKWKTFSLEYIYVHKDAFALFGYQSDLYYRYGLQTHEFVTIIPESTNSSNLLPKSTMINNASLGLACHIRTQKRARAEILMHYQYPLSSLTSNPNNRYSVTPNLSFDGSLGYIFELNEHLSLGSYWFGQWQDFRFRYRQGNESYDGTQQLFNSTIDVRVGYEF